MTFIDELLLFLKSRYPVLHITSIEEERVEYILRKNIKNTLKRSIFTWDFIDGYSGNPNHKGIAERNPMQALEFIERLNPETPAVFILKDYNRFINDLAISRKLRNLSRVLKLQPKTIIIIGSELNIPKELQDLITVVQFQLPLEEEIIKELNRLIEVLKIDVEIKVFENLARSCQGLSLRAYSTCISQNYCKFSND